MDYDDFTGEVQHRLEFAGTGESVRAIRATLMTLGSRIQEGSATDLAGSLPMEINWYLTGAPDSHGERFGWDEFVDRVCEIEDIEPSQAAFHAQVIVDLVCSIVPESDVEELRDQLPEDDDENWDKLFELMDQGGWAAQEGEEPVESGAPENE